jgi:hypothetical protein
LSLSPVTLTCLPSFSVIYGVKITYSFFFLSSIFTDTSRLLLVMPWNRKLREKRNHFSFHVRRKESLMGLVDQAVGVSGIGGALNACFLDRAPQTKQQNKLKLN